MSCPTLLRLTTRALLAESAATSDATQLASAFNRLRSRLRARLDGVFGQPAVAALFTRGHGVAAEAFPWLSAEVAPASHGTSHLAAPEAPEARPAATIVEGLATELAECLTLLSTMLGTELVLHFAEDAWSASLAGVPRQRSSEYSLATEAADARGYGHGSHTRTDAGNEPLLGL